MKVVSMGLSHVLSGSVYSLLKSSRALKLVGLVIMLFVGKTTISSIQAAENQFVLSGDNCKIEFIGYKPTGKHSGGFKKLTGSAMVAGDITSLKLTIDIDMNSLYSDDTKLTGHLKSPDFFNVKENPKSKFVSSKVEKTDSGYNIVGDLTINGKSKSISIPSMIEIKDGNLKIKSDFKINRTDFGITYGKGIINNEVDLKVNVSASK